MIDLFDIGITISHKRFGGVRVINREASPSPTNKYLSKRISLHEGGYQIFVTSINSTKIGIRCSPLKALQGHNVFGSNDVRALAFAVICRVLNQMKIKYTNAQRASWKKGNFDIEALDITHRFKLPPGVVVRDICEHMLRSTSISFKPQWLTEGTGLRLHPPHSSIEWLLYDKEQVLSDKRMRAERYLRAVVGDQHGEVWGKLCKTASQSIRAELKLPKTYLKRHKLDRGTKWSVKRAHTLYFLELEQLRLGVLNDLPLPDEAIGLVENRALKQTLVLWSLRQDLSQLLSRSTLNGHRRHLEKLTGIDILHDVPCAGTLRLSEMFKHQNVRKDFPAWADSYPLVAYVAKTPEQARPEMKTSK
jgi:hypothetical protein